MQEREQHPHWQFSKIWTANLLTAFQELIAFLDHRISMASGQDDQKRREVRYVGGLEEGRMVKKKTDT